MDPLRHGGGPVGHNSEEGEERVGLELTGMPPAGAVGLVVCVVRV